DIALSAGYAARDQRVDLGAFFDALGNDAHVHVPGQPHQHADHDGGRYVAIDRIDEELVDLERIGPQPLNLRQPAVTDADIVYCHLEAEFANLGDTLRRRGGWREHCAVWPDPAGEHFSTANLAGLQVE